MNSKKSKAIILTLMTLAAIVLVSINVTGPSDTVVPIIGEEAPQFSLDAEIVGSADLDSVYLLEYRGSPNYRIFEYSPQATELKEVFNVPERGLVYGMSLSPDGDQLAVSFTTEFTSNGNGVYLLNLTNDSPELKEVIAEEADAFYFDLEWGDANELWASRTTSTNNISSNDIVKIQVDNGEAETIATNAIDPAVLGQSVAYLPLESDNSRRSVEIYSIPDESVLEVDVFNKEYDLDNLIYNPTSNELLVAGLSRSNGLTFRFGEVVHAHGNHSIPSSWVILGGEDYASVSDAVLDSKLVFDSTFDDQGRILEVTNEGLYVGDPQGERELIIKSRALRFIAY